MKTLRLDMSSSNYDNSIACAAEILLRDGLVAIPTETVYGLAASANSDTAIKKIFAAKGRPQDNPLIVHISDMNMLNKVSSEVSPCAMRCAAAFWPGPFTMVLKKSDGIAQSVSAGLDTVAVRMPSNKTARDLIKKCGLPLAAPSANVSGAPSPTTTEHVINDLDGKIDAVLIDKDCTVGVESTVVALFGDKPRLLRPGAVTVEQLLEVLPDLQIDNAVLNEVKEGENVASPGMKYKHYAPKTDTVLVEGNSNDFVDFVNSKHQAVAICFDEEANEIHIKKIPYGSIADESTLAKNVFSVLRTVDDMLVETVYIHAPSKSGVGLAVYNRLIRAAAYKVIIL